MLFLTLTQLLDDWEKCECRQQIKCTNLKIKFLRKKFHSIYGACYSFGADINFQLIRLCYASKKAVMNQTRSTLFPEIALWQNEDIIVLIAAGTSLADHLNIRYHFMWLLSLSLFVWNRHRVFHVSYCSFHSYL